MSIVHDYLNQLPNDAPEVLRQAFVQIGNIDDRLANLLPAYNNGKVDSPLGSVPTNPVTPPACVFEVDGVDGSFQLTVTLPQNTPPATVAMFQQLITANQNSLLAPMVHQAQSATTVNFDAASNVTSYDLGSNLTFEIQDPNQTKFWRLRSSFDGQAWNAWQIFISAEVCGPVAVQSGFLRSTSLAANSPTNTSNNVTVDSVDAGSNDTIRAFGALGGVGSSWTRFDGQGNQILVPAGTILGASYDSDYTVDYSNTDGYHAFPNLTQYVQSLTDSFFFVGLLHTVKAGGTGGTSGGGGSTSGSSGGGEGGRPLEFGV